jgi:hypothetical protein
MEEINEMILDAIKRDEKPPKAFVLAVLSGEIQLSDNVMNALIDKGWINRQKCEVWTRVMGYFRPVSQFNAGKKSEYAERVLPRVEDIKAVTES